MRTKSILEIIIVIFGLAISNFLINNIPIAKAITDFEPDPDDPPATGLEYWDFNEGNIVSWKITLYEDDKLFASYIEYYNISEITYEYNNNKLSNFYMVKLSEMYFNTSSNSLKEIPNSELIPRSLINFTSNEMYATDEDFIVMPNLFIPHNGITGLHLAWCSQALLTNEYNFFFNPSIQIIGNEILITENSAFSESYIDLIYSSNGILNTGEIYISYGGFKINYTRNFDFNPLDEVEWCVDKDDFFYMGFGLNEFMYKIVDFINENNDNTAWQRVIANRSVWNIESERWEQISTNETIGCANEIMICPYIIVPRGTTGYDFETIILATSYDMRDYGDYWFRFENTTSGDLFEYHYFPNGLLKYNYGYNSNLDEYFCEFFKNMTELSFNNNEIKFNVYNLENFYNITAEVEISNNIQFFFAGIPENPSYIPLSNAILYFDLMANDTEYINFPINLTIEYDLNLKGNYKLWYFNDSLSVWDWKEIPLNDDKNGNLTASIDHLSLFALTVSLDQSFPLIIDSDDDDDDDNGNNDEPNIPFGNFYIIFMVVGIIAIIIYKKRNLILNKT